MTSLSETIQNRLLDHVFRGVAYVPPVAVYAALFESETQECAFAGYRRVPVTFEPAVAGALGSDGPTRFSAKEDMGLVTITHGALFDAVAGGSALTDITALDEPTALGMHDMFEFPAGDLYIEWAD